ncbi:hypothetical protein KGM_211347 [Danaus plexippus plexippus]|uniref:Uncharacterized protein n=1 Tax=Danaus plexippus plexippus TaxID=278856 RepID=A0A212EMU6_DANPL|nr:hypothetical protein KGM_211347 [Danaus plexippus plexippus]
MKFRRMMPVLEAIRIVVVISFINSVCTQDEYSNLDLIRLQQYAVNNGQGDPLINYNSNTRQKDPNSSANEKYHTIDDTNDGDYNRSDRGGSRKVYRIKNPFQQTNDIKPLQDSNYSQDSATGASNQNPAMQYSLPPEEFLQQMRENQYHQQQQLSTQASYTVTPQPSYQYSTIAAQHYENMQQSNQIAPVEPRVFTPVYQSNGNTYQYNQNAYNLNNQHNTPLPPYISTPSSQYIDTSGNNYASTSLPYVSSQQTLQQYVSSPISHIPTGAFDFNNNRATTVASNVVNYNINDQNKRMQIDHYDNSINGIRYPLQNQYQNEYISSTISPSSTPYPDSIRDTLQNSINALSKSEQAYIPIQYQSYRYNNNQQDIRQPINSDNTNNDIYRKGNMPSPNNIYLNYAQPDQPFNEKGRSRDNEQESSPSEVYSHGDYGWKLSERKTSFGSEVSTNPNNYFKYQIQNLQPETGAITQVNFQMDSSKLYNNDQNIKPVSEKLEPDEFTRAAAKVHENYIQQLEASKYTNSQYNNNGLTNSVSYYNYNDKQKNKFYSDNSNPFGYSQSESITTSPFYYSNQKDTDDAKSKYPFDHDKALKNIVPIDVSNVIQNADSQAKGNSDSDGTNRYSIISSNKDSSDSRPTSDLYYKDKNPQYSNNFKTKADEVTDSDKLRQVEQSGTLFGKPYSFEGFYNHNINTGNKRPVDEMTQLLNYANQMSNSHQDNAQRPTVIHQGLQQRPQISSDYGSILKLNDLPFRLTQGFNSDPYRLHNSNYGNIPTPLPVRINQNVENHHIDVATEILNKLMASKRNIPVLNTNRPEVDSQIGSFISTINGFKVANPFNVDLKLVADVLKGKPAIDDSQMTSFRGDYSKSLPMKLDITQLQQLLQLKNDNAMSFNTGGNTLSNSYFDIYNGGRIPYQGVKYSRSEEEPENIPITDSSNNHPIGAVIEESVSGQDAPNLSETQEENLSSNIEEDNSKGSFGSSNPLERKPKHPDSEHISRYTHKRKYPKLDADEPYPLLKPPPPRTSRHRFLPKDKIANRRRVNRPKMFRVLKTEPLFEVGSDDEDKPATHYKYSFAQDKLDVVDEEEST